MVDDNEEEADDVVDDNIEHANDQSNELEYSDGIDDSDADSIVAPPYSPIRSANKENIVLPPYSPISNANEEVDLPTNSEMVALSSSSFNAAIAESYLIILWNGDKFIGDNVDKALKTSFQWNDHKGLSIHCFHGDAVRDRIDFEGLSEVCP